METQPNQQMENQTVHEFDRKCSCKQCRLFSLVDDVVFSKAEGEPCLLEQTLEDLPVVNLNQDPSKIQDIECPEISDDMEKWMNQCCNGKLEDIGNDLQNAHENGDNEAFTECLKSSIKGLCQDGSLQKLLKELPTRTIDLEQWTKFVHDIVRKADEDDSGETSCDEEAVIDANGD